jgi:hypothetical protein
MKYNDTIGQVAFQPSLLETRPDTFLDSIEKRAYFLYLNSAASHGHDLEHWLVAEKQTNSERRWRKL